MAEGKKRIKETDNFTVNTDIPYSIGNINITERRELILFLIGSAFIILAVLWFISALFFDVNAPLFSGIIIANFGLGGALFSFTGAVHFKRTVCVICVLLTALGIAIIALAAPSEKQTDNTIADEVVVNIPQTVPDSLYIDSSKPTAEKRTPNTYYPGETATITYIGTPFTSYSISVYYSSSSPSTAKGLERKTSDANGIVSWSWKIGSAVKPGGYRIVIEGGGEETEKFFVVKETT